MEYSKGSIFLRYLKKGYLAIEEKISPIYLNSFMHRSMRKTFAVIKAGFKFSLLGRITQLNDDYAPKNSFATSNVIMAILNAMKGLRNKLTATSATSKLVVYLSNLKCGFYSMPVKAAGIIVVTAIMMNTFLALLLHKEMNLIGIIYRLILFFLGILGIFSEVDCEALISNSIILKRIRKRDTF